MKCPWQRVLSLLLCLMGGFLSIAGAQQEPYAPGLQDGCLPSGAFGDRDRPLAELLLDITERSDRLPADCSMNLFSGPTAVHSHSARELDFYWAASELYHQPTYFDDTLLERYGQTRHPLLQPILSGAHFFGTFPIMPYMMGLDRTHDRVYTLGYYRPGSPTPCLGYRLPLEFDAALFESGTWLALVFLLP